MLHRAAKRLRTTLLALWHAAHLKNQGQYSVERLRAFNLHLRTVSKARDILALLWTPLPALVVISCTDLFQLAPPEDGIRHNGTFWVRIWTISTFMIGTLMLQLSIFLPGLNMRTRDIAAITLFTSCTATTMIIPMAMLIGFPLPFTITLCSPYTSTCLCTCTALRYGRHLLRDETLRRQLLQYGIFLSLQYALTLVYPVFAFIFNQADSAVLETLLACLLPLAKLFIKIAMSRATTSLPEVRPALLMFNVEVFNALFIASCLQNASSVVTTIFVIALDCFYNVTTFRSVAKHLSALSDIITAGAGPVISPRTSRRELTPDAINFIECAMYLLQDDAVSKAVTSNLAKKSTTAPRIHVQTIAQVAPTSTVPGTESNDEPTEPATTVTARYETRTTISQRTALDSLAPEKKVTLVRGVLDLVYVTEFVLLTEFVEIVVPIIYAVYLSVVYELPNRAYYPQLRDVSADDNARAVRRVLTYVTLEIASFFVFERLLRRKMKLDLARQLGFVLLGHWWFLPAKLMLWVAFILQCSIQHYGVDYSLQFAWLRNGTVSGSHDTQT